MFQNQRAPFVQLTKEWFISSARSHRMDKVICSSARLESWFRRGKERVRILETGTNGRDQSRSKCALAPTPAKIDWTRSIFFPLEIIGEPLNNIIYISIFLGQDSLWSSLGILSSLSPTAQQLSYATPEPRILRPVTGPIPE